MLRRLVHLDPKFVDASRVLHVGWRILYQESAADHFVRPCVAPAISWRMHELATNAIKYGALSVPEGRVAIEWSIKQRQGKRHLFFCWGEHDGPTVTLSRKMLPARMRRIWQNRS